MSKKPGAAGFAAILLIAALRRSESDMNPQSGSYRSRPFSGFLPGGGIIRAFEAESVLRDLHRITEIINRMDSVGQVVLNPPPLPKLPPPSQLLGSLPDLSSIMGSIGPLMAALGSGHTDSDDENENAIF